MGTIQNFFQNGVLDEACNKTSIVLIPKKLKPDKITDLRMIALCNVMYKIITKVLANRLKPLLDGIVSPSRVRLSLVA